MEENGRRRRGGRDWGGGSGRRGGQGTKGKWEDGDGGVQPGAGADRGKKNTQGRKPCRFSAFQKRSGVDN